MTFLFFVFGWVNLLPPSLIISSWASKDLLRSPAKYVYPFPPSGRQKPSATTNYFVSSSAKQLCYTFQEPSPTDNPREDPQYCAGLKVQWFFSLIFVPVLLPQCKLLYEVVMCLLCAYVCGYNQVHDDTVLPSEVRSYLVRGAPGCGVNEESYQSLAVKHNIESGTCRRQRDVLKVIEVKTSLGK